jgi:hypothetical protein
MATASPTVGNDQTTDTQGQLAEGDLGESQQQEGQQADSSTDDDGAKPANVFEAARAALASDAESKKAGAESPTAGETDGEQGSEQAQEASEEEDVPTAEEMLADKNLSHKTRKRIQQLLHERQELSVPAENWNELQGWVGKNGLSQEDFSQGLAIMAMCNRDPFRAIEALRGVLGNLEQQVGIGQLPSDIQQKLDAGLIDDETAQELAQGRLRTNFHGLREREMMQQSREDRERQEIENRANEAGNAVTAWERNWQKNDPDYQKLKPLVTAEIVRLINTEGVPDSGGAAVKQAQAALENVKKVVSGFRPGKQEIRTVTGGQSANVSASKPKSSFEAAKSAIGG